MCRFHVLAPSRPLGPTGRHCSTETSPLTDSATALPSPRHPLSDMHCPTQASSATRRHSERQPKILQHRNPQPATQKPSKLPDPWPLPGCTTTHYPYTSAHRCFSSQHPSSHPSARMDSSALTGSAGWRHNHRFIRSHLLFATGPPQPHVPTLKTTQLSFDEAQPCTPSKLLFVLECTPW